jgi:hypothetical protein
MAAVIDPPVEAPARDEASPRSGDRRVLMVGLAVATIWLATGLACLFAPDMVTGSQQEHLPIAALSDWLFAALATALVLLAAGMNSEPAPADRSPWPGFCVAVAAIWLVVAAASIFGPVMVTGTDPTRIPITALLSPIAGLTATAFLSVFVAGWRARDEGRGH